MCHERERLIDFLYGECDEAERTRVEAHLAGCESCRDVVGGLRRVRDDLLGWDIPARDPVWTPFGPARPAPWWREVPAWALAAAAGLMLMAGAAGGAATHALLRPAPSSGTAAAAAQISEADVAAMMQALRAEMQERLDRLAARPAAPLPTRTVSADLPPDVRRFMNTSAEERQVIFDLIDSLYKDVGRLRMTSDDELTALRREVHGVRTALVSAPIK